MVISDQLTPKEKAYVLEMVSLYLGTPLEQEDLNFIKKKFLIESLNFQSQRLDKRKVKAMEKIILKIKGL